MYFFCSQFSYIVVFREIISIKLLNLLVVLFMIFAFEPSNACKNFSDSSSLILDFGNSCVHPLPPFLNLARCLSTLFFQRTKFPGFFWFDFPSLYFYSNLNHFFASAFFGLNNLFLFNFLRYLWFYAFIIL